MTRNKTLEASVHDLHRPKLRTPRPWTPGPGTARSGEYLVPRNDGPAAESYGDGHPDLAHEEWLVIGEHISGERPAVRSEHAEESAWDAPEGAFEAEEPISLEAEPLDEDDIEASASSGFGLSWDYLLGQSTVPVGIQLRALVEALKALEILHTGGESEPLIQGAVSHHSLMFRRDGTAFCLLDDDSARQQPAQYRAPEVLAGAEPSAQSDVFSVGVMVLETLTGLALLPRETSGIRTEDVGQHPVFSRYAHDPLVLTALRAIAERPQARWSSAGEFAYGLVKAGAGRIEDVPTFVSFLRDSLQRSEDRATPLMAPPKSGDALIYDIDDADFESAEVVALEVAPDAIGRRTDELMDAPPEAHVALLPYEPGSWQVVPEQLHAVPSEETSLESTEELPANIGALDWSQYLPNDTPPGGIARHSHTMVSADAARTPGKSSKLWSRLLVLAGLVGTASGAVANVGVDRTLAWLGASSPVVPRGERAQTGAALTNQTATPDELQIQANHTVTAGKPQVGVGSQSESSSPPSVSMIKPTVSAAAAPGASAAAGIAQPTGNSQGSATPKEVSKRKPVTKVRRVVRKPKASKLRSKPSAAYDDKIFGKRL